MDNKNELVEEELFEHMRNNADGSFAGLYSLDPEKADGKTFWEKVDSVIRAYAELHPKEMELQVLQNKILSETRTNELASSEGGTLRWGMSIPPTLYLKLNQVAPEIFEEKQIYLEFLNKYKGFRICKKI